MTTARSQPQSVPRNRRISAFVVAFAGLSLVASVLPLLTRGPDDASLVPGLERGASFATYSAFLLLFVFFLLPGGFRRDPGKTLLPWAPLAALALMFGAIPAVVSAYISGVAFPQALLMGALVAGAASFVLLLRAWVGEAGAAIAFMAGGLTLFVIPGIEALAWSTGSRIAEPLSTLSLASWLRRLAFVREGVDPWPAVLVAGVLWSAVAVTGARRARRGAALLACLALVVPSGAGARSVPDVVIRPMLGPVARAGVRLPFLVTAGARGGDVAVSFRTETAVVPADGQPHALLVTLAEGETDAEFLQGGDRVRVPMPVRWPAAARPFVGAVGGGWLPDSVREVLDDAEVFPVDLAALPGVPGSLEACDALVVEAVEWDAARPAHRALVEGYAALGGSVFVVASPAASRPESNGAGSRLPGSGIHRVASVWDLDGTELRRRIDPSAFDPTLRSLFARPDWQALDLTRLMLFLLVYHGAFLLVFLFPLALDSHKSTAVYLVSVGTVMIVVVAASWWSLRQFFLRDNQVYTQALTFASMRAGDPLVAVRQFRCYASMSGESRDFPWPGERNLVAYRDPGAPRRVFSVRAPGRLTDVWLDRFQSKLLVREDLAIARPVELVAEDGGFRVRPVPGVADPLGLRLCTLRAAAVLEAEGAVRDARVDGNRIVIEGGGGAPGATALDPMARALVGRFLRGAGDRPGRRILIVRAQGTTRLDDTSGFFKTEDRDAVLAFDL